MFFGSNTLGESNYDLLLETAKFADKSNFSAIWIPERHFGDLGAAFPSPSVLSGALSMITENIDIRSGSIVLPLHDPIRIAEDWSVIDRLSKGRIGLSIASGWRPDDFIFPGADYTNRHLQMKDGISTLKKIWKGELVKRKNGEGKQVDIKVRPLPISKELPLWITASGSEETFEYAGRIGANLLTHMLKQSPDKLKESIEIYHQALRDNGFQIDEKKVVLMLHTYLDTTEQIAVDVCEKPFKNYLKSTISLMDSKTQQMKTKLDIESLINMSYKKYDRNNTLIGTPESCQELLYQIEEIGVTEVACFVDFGIEKDKVLSGIKRITEARDLYNLTKMYHGAY